MLRKIFAAIILIPLALIIILFAVANRQTVTVVFDPFDTANPALALTLPLFLLVFVLVGLGVLLGGIAAWLRQHKWRTRARLAESEARRHRAETGRPSNPADTTMGGERRPLFLPPAA